MKDKRKVNVNVSIIAVIGLFISPLAKCPRESGLLRSCAFVLVIQKDKNGKSRLFSLQIFTSALRFKSKI